MYIMGQLPAPFGFGNKLQVNSTHFFLDIGSGNNGIEGGFSHTRKLEESGWKGVCVDPVPDRSRSCTTLGMAVTAKRGQDVMVSDCRGQEDIVKISGGTEKCKQVKRNGMSVLDVLKITKAPHVIDFMNLDTEGAELTVLKAFPFKDFCVRAWSIQHRNETANKDGAMDVLQGLGCKVTDTGSAHWARCTCKDFADSLLEKEMAQHSKEEASDSSIVRNRKQRTSSKMQSLEVTAAGEKSTARSTIHAAEKSFMKQ